MDLLSLIVPTQARTVRRGTIFIISSRSCNITPDLDIPRVRIPTVIFRVSDASIGIKWIIMYASPVIEVFPRNDGGEFPPVNTCRSSLGDIQRVKILSSKHHVVITPSVIYEKGRQVNVSSRFILNICTPLTYNSKAVETVKGICLHLFILLHYSQLSIHPHYNAMLCCWS